ncbi:hypothetical protein HDU96_009800 [Phlyctochytrium bullatum]|nr:hypothetical protein HDU96_009800 [Phlyctochytrium bullatum]
MLIAGLPLLLLACLGLQVAAQRCDIGPFYVGTGSSLDSASSGDYRGTYVNSDALATGHLCSAKVPLRPVSQAFVLSFAVYRGTESPSDIVAGTSVPLALKSKTYSGYGGEYLEIDFCTEDLSFAGSTSYIFAFLVDSGTIYFYSDTTAQQLGFQGSTTGGPLANASPLSLTYAVSSKVDCEFLGTSSSELSGTSSSFATSSTWTSSAITSTTSSDAATSTTDSITTSSSVAPPVTSTSESPVGTSTTSDAPVLPSSTVASTTTLVYDGTCDGVRDGEIVCRSPNTFNFCIGGKFMFAVEQRCAEGTICCKDTNKCDFAFNCPSYPKDTTDPCYGKRDKDIICTAPNKFKICSQGISTLFAELSCQPGLVCCEALNRCDFSCAGQSLVAPLPTSNPPPAPTVPVQPPGPGPTNCAGQGDGNIVCKTLKTFNFCINGQFLTTPDLSCPEGTVCCASSQSCDFQFNCKSVRPTVVNPPSATNAPVTSGAPLPTILPATCQGRANGNIICKSDSMFNFCIDNGQVAAPDQSCPPGTVCCQAKNTCDFAFNCPPVVVISPSPSPVPAPAPSSAPAPPAPATSTRAVLPSVPITVPASTVTATPTIPYGSCAGAAAGELTCVSRTSFKFCLADGGVLNSDPQPCPAGTICCASTRSCVRAGSCPDPATTASGTSAAPVPTSVFNRNCGGSFTGFKCTSKNTFNFCEDGVLNVAADQSCAGGLVCCPTLGGCTFETQCPIAVGAAAQDYMPPVPAYTGSGVSGTVCNGVLDGAVVCLTDKEFNYCLSDGRQ